MVDRIVLSSAALCAGIVIWSGPRNGSLRQWILGALFLVWVLLPFHLVRRVTRSGGDVDPASVVDRTLRGVAWLFAIGTPVLYWQALFGSGRSSTSALIFIFLPLYQLLLIGGVSLFGGWIDNRNRRRS